MLKAAKSYIKDHYGSRRGLLNYYRFKLAHDLFDKFKEYSPVDWTRVDRLVFICHGNICRSPLAAVVLQQRFDLPALSYGLQTDISTPADPRAVAFARAQNLDLSRHRSQPFQVCEVTAGDLIVGMEPIHLHHLHAHQVAHAQTSLLGFWLDKPCPYIHDPYMSNMQFFNRCESRVIAAAEALAQQWLAARQ